VSLIAEISEVAGRVNEEIYSHLEGKPKLLYEAALHLIRQGGKRLRPFVLVKSAGMFGGSVESSVRLAAAVEMLHNFTLIHDDIMDEDTFRRGAPTVHVLYGIPMAILAGDLLFAESFKTSVIPHGLELVPEGRRMEVTRAIAEATVEICEGQALDILAGRSEELPSKEEIVRLMELKTGALYKASAKMGALLAGASAEDCEKMAEFGRQIGIAFQLVDDILGTLGDPKVTGKPIGRDLLEGKKTLLVKIAFERMGEEDRMKVLKVFGKKTADEGDVREAIEAIRRSGAGAEVKRMALKYAEASREILEAFPPSPARESLLELIKFIVERER